MNDEPQHKHRKYWIFCIVAVFIAILGVILPEQEFTPKQYINASNITVVGATITSGNLINLSDINAGYINISESTVPYYVDINFTNVTRFSFLEVKARYFSTTGTPSTHIVDLEIWCEMDQAFDDLKDLDNHTDWQYFTKHIPDYSHFIRPDGNVTIRLNHTANGNTNHRLWIDTARLITTTQYEQNNIVLNQYFNSTTSGGGGVSNLSNLTIDANKDWMNKTISNVTIIGSMNYSNITNAPKFEQLIYQNHTCCYNRTFINLTGLSINNDSFYKVYSIINSSQTVNLQIYINNDINSSNYTRTYVYASGAVILSATDYSSDISAVSPDESGQVKLLIMRAHNGKIRIVGEGNFNTLVFFNMQMIYNNPVDDVNTLNFKFTQPVPTGLNMNVFALR